MQQNMKNQSIAKHHGILNQKASTMEPKSMPKTSQNNATTYIGKEMKRMEIHVLPEG